MSEGPCDRQFHTGDPCPLCGVGHMSVYHTHVERMAAEPHRLQYLRCNQPECRYKPPRNKVRVPLQFAPSRFRPRKLVIRRRKS